VQIGSHTLANNLIVAPMAGVTDRPFRQLCKRLGAGMAVSEMVASDPRLWKTAKSLRRVDHDGEVEPVTVQIAGADPSTMALAARHNVERGARIIDINMGCPAKKVCNVAAGSALLRDESLVARIFAAVKAAVDVPVTVKIRTGWSPEQRNAVRVARLAQDAGLAAVAIHGRTRACGFSGTAEYATIAAVRAELSIPVIANGDIGSPQQARRVLALTGADAVMIGRGAQGRPWVFREIAHFLAHGELLPAPTVAEVHEIVLTHLDAHYRFHGEEAGVRTARKHLGWYLEGLAGGAQCRRDINLLESSAEQVARIGEFFRWQATLGRTLSCAEREADNDEMGTEEALAA
jgi:tRNA-dihydrouridine synthase B